MAGRTSQDGKSTQTPGSNSSPNPLEGLLRTSQGWKILLISILALALIIGINVFVIRLAPPSLEKLRSDFEKQRYFKAEAEGQRLLSILETRSGPDSLEVAQVLDFLVELALESGSYWKSDTLPRARRALDIKQRLLGSEDLETLVTQRNLGRLALPFYRYQEASSRFQNVLAERERILGKHHPLIAESLTDMARIAGYLEGHLVSKELLMRAYSILVKADSDPLDLVRILKELSVVHRRADDCGAARDSIQRAIEIQLREAPYALQLASLYEEMSTVESCFGDTLKSENYWNKALDIRFKWTPHSIDIAASLLSVSQIQASKGDLNSARDTIHEVQSRFPAQLIAHPWIRHHILTRSADLAIRLEDFAAAEKYYRQDWELYRSHVRFPQMHRGPMLGLAEVLQLQGKFKEALEILLQVWDLMKNNPTIRIRRKASTLYRTSMIYASLGQDEEAFDAAEDAERIGRRLLLRHLKALPERPAFRQAIWRIGGIDCVLGLVGERLHNLPAGVQRLWNAVIRVRGLVYEEFMERRRLASQERDLEISELDRQIRQARTTLSRVQIAGRSDARHSFLERFEKARNYKEELEERLAARLQERDHPEHLEIGFAEVSEALPADSALVAYSRFPRHQLPLSTDNTYPREPTPAYYAFVLTGQRVRAFQIGTAREIRDLVLKAFKQTAPSSLPSGPLEVLDEKQYRHAASLVRQRIWDPISEFIQGSERILVVPDGVLHFVNFAALPTGQHSYLVERGPLFHYLPAERDLVQLHKNRLEEPGQGILILGQPRFTDSDSRLYLVDKRQPKEHTRRVLRGLRSNRTEFEATKLPPLPFSRIEASQVADLWRSHKSHEPVTTIESELASEDRFRRLAQGVRVLHLATHSLLITRARTGVPGNLRGTGGMASDPDTAYIDENNPLLFAGLALAGANQRQEAPPGMDDGILTAEEVQNLDLRGVEWVVLSACETGRGEVQYGEGIRGLPWAFRLAGARTLILSLWPVEDQAAQEWMAALYRARLVEGTDTPHSLREASRRILHSRRRDGRSTHPFYWGSFISLGDWR